MFITVHLFVSKTGRTVGRDLPLLLNFISVSLHVLAHAEERLHQGDSFTNSLFHRFEK